MNNSDEVQRLQNQLDELREEHEYVLATQEEVRRLAVIVEEAIGALFHRIYGWEMYKGGR
jgi:hypothetical protein